MTGDYLYASPQPAESDEERLAMEAVMESVDPATWPGLTTAQRCALGRFAKPQSAEQQPAPDVKALVEALERIASWPNGGNRSGQTHIQMFAAKTLATYRKGAES